MSLFKSLPGTVVLGSKGTYTESPLFELDNQIYAKHGKTYIRLRANGSTSRDKVFWKAIETPVEYHFPIGNMTLLPQKIKVAS
jgi:hypothetical protein